MGRFSVSLLDVNIVPIIVQESNSVSETPVACVDLASHSACA
jgi:hypothetical protein